MSGIGRPVLITFDIDNKGQDYYSRFREKSNERWPKNVYTGVDHYIDGIGPFFAPLKQIRLLLTNNDLAEIRGGIKRLIGPRPIFVTRLSNDWAGCAPPSNKREKFRRWLREQYREDEINEFIEKHLL